MADDPRDPSATPDEQDRIDQVAAAQDRHRDHYMQVAETLWRSMSEEQRVAFNGGPGAGPVPAGDEQEQERVLHDGGPWDGEHHPVALVSGRLPARVEHAEYAPGSESWPGGPVAYRVHAYDLVDGAVGRARPLYVYQDSEA